MTSTLQRLKPSTPSVRLLVEADPPSSIPLRGFSTFYLASTLPAIPPHRSHQLVVLRPNLYGLLRLQGIQSRILIPPDPNVITMVPRRDITRIKSSGRTPQQDSNRRYVIITHRPFKDAAHRQKASRLAIRLPSIRIKPGLVLVPQIKTSRFQEYPLLLRPSEYAREIVQLGATVWYASRLEAYASETLIDQMIEDAFITRSQRIVATCKQLYRDLRGSSPPQKTTLEVKEQLASIRFRLKVLRAQGRFFARECGLDVKFTASRAAAAMSRLRCYLEICD